MIVVDCAAVVDALTVAPGTDELRAALAEEELHAPHLIDVEVVSTIRGLVRGGHLSPGRAQDALLDFNDLPIRRWPSGSALRERMFTLRGAVISFDAAYVALAEALPCPLITRDARLARSSGHDAIIRVL